jgi:hypothetical protein
MKTNTPALLHDNRSHKRHAKKRILSHRLEPKEFDAIFRVVVGKYSMAA